jgi:hypothetical protein
MPGGPKCYHMYPYKREAEGALSLSLSLSLSHTHTHTHTPRRYEDRTEREWKIPSLKTRVMATRQGIPAATRSWKRQETESPQEPLEGLWSC